MIYTNPREVNSPKGVVEVLNILCDKGENSYSIAELRWEGRKCYGIRWNISRGERNNSEKRQEIKNCIGMPSSRGYATWFILPKEINENIDLLIK